MLVRIRTSGEVLQEYMFRSMYPDTSFPETLTTGVLSDFDADFVYPGIIPVVGENQYAKEDGVELIDGKWYTKFDVIDFTPEQIAERLLLKRQAMIVSPLQAKVELLERELLDEVEAVIAASTDPVIIMAWNSATQFARLSPLVAVIAEELEWDDVYLDALFTEAAERTF